ncbi:hypothetical protein AB0I52_13330 [Streptomyces sp. NPDC050423]|uniref:hypothetical protein n=1 Tax=Streptomyces sp. NPDC050423 TaxID=3155402 RepID=UPI00342C5EC8
MTLTTGVVRGAGLAAYTAGRLPRTTSVVRKAAQVSRLMCLSGPMSVAVRDFIMSTVSRLGPGLVLRTFDGIADWCPPQHTYAAGTKDAPVQPRWTTTDENRDARR